MADSYVCLCCADRPVFDGKILAYAHARDVHRELLQDVHVDELFEVKSCTPETDPNASKTGPYFCLCSESCQVRFVQRASVENHLWSQHSIGNPVYGEHFINEVDRFRREAAKRREDEAKADVFAQRLATVVGVTDFLTECGA